MVSYKNMKKTIKEWLDEHSVSILSRVDLKKKITEEEFKELLKNHIIFENKYYSK